MLVFVLAPIYLFVNFYVIRWALRWMGACHKHLQHRYFRIGFVSLYLFLCLTPLSSFLIKEGWLHRALKITSNYWLGTFLYILLIILLTDTARILIRYTPIRRLVPYASKKLFIFTGTICTIAIIGISLYGMIHAKNIHTTNYDLTIASESKNMDSLKIILVADFHLGYNTTLPDVRRMVEKINACDADLVVIAGDIFDNEYNALYKPEKMQDILKAIQSRYGVYACYGNHDINEEILAGFTFHSTPAEKDDIRMQQFLTDSGITLLEDETVLIDDTFYLVGRKDYSRSKKLQNMRMSIKELTSGLDKDKPVIVMDHQPRELEELAACGVDLCLSGHTHNGQMFPGNLGVWLAWENPYGLLEKNGMYSIVTSGVGVWGPNMRVGTKSEIVNITIQS